MIEAKEIADYLQSIKKDLDLVKRYNKYIEIDTISYQITNIWIMFNRFISEYKTKEDK